MMGAIVYLTTKWGGIMGKTLRLLNLYRFVQYLLLYNFFFFFISKAWSDFHVWLSATPPQTSPSWMRTSKAMLDLPSVSSWALLTTPCLRRSKTTFRWMWVPPWSNTQVILLFIILWDKSLGHFHYTPPPPPKKMHFRCVLLLGFYLISVLRVFWFPLITMFCYIESYYVEK